ncbi:MAG: hypothetical protein HYZ69_00800 [Candidatus Colwellbacteria bacterium]|nr:hypothetical protein [Candidatus Colwellbacteria bacterium]
MMLLISGGCTVLFALFGLCFHNNQIRVYELLSFGIALTSFLVFETMLHK